MAFTTFQQPRRIFDERRRCLVGVAAAIQLGHDDVGAHPGQLECRGAADTSTAARDVDPLDAPITEEFRVGTMGLGWDAESKAVVIELLAISEEEVDEAVVLDDTEEGPDAVRVFLSPSAARAFAERADRVINAGRKPCPLCAEPLDADGHICPRENGYRRTEED